MQTPETYDITIIVAPSGQDDIHLEVKLRDIPRESIMAPDYDKGMQAVVKTFEDMVLDGDTCCG